MRYMAILTIRRSAQFKKDLRLLNKRGYNFDLLDVVVETLANKQELPPKYKNHALSGNYKGYFECHIKSNWLLVYKIDNNELILILSRTGTHSDLFKK